MSGKTAVVIGAGIVGVSVALWIQRRGHRVILLDRGEPGMGTSYGNACIIANYGCIPINSPGLFTALPSLLWSRESPLRLDPFHALRHPGWMLDFLRNCTPARVDRTVRALSALLSRTGDGLDPLVGDAGAESLIRRDGSIYAYATRRAYEDAVPSNRRRAEEGAVFDTIDGRELRDLEPAIDMGFYRALRFTDAQQVANPKTLVDRYMEHFSARGGVFRRACVRMVEPDPGVILDDGERIPADTVVVSAGAYSRTIAGAGTGRLPLDVERGYHVQFPGRQSLLGRPVAWAERGFYATPTTAGLRFAGTVEIAALDKPPSPARIEYLTRNAKRMFGLEEDPAQSWLGFRPTFPDALPVIGPSPVSPDILLAFGHHHLGLTLSGITGMLISEIMEGRRPSLDITPYSAGRFS